MKDHPPFVVRPRSAAISLLLLACGLPACVSDSPIRSSTEQELRQSVLESVRRELRDAEGQPASQTTTRNDATAELTIKPALMGELSEMSVIDTYDPARDMASLPNDLMGRPQETRLINLERSIRSCVAGNLQVQFAQLAPAISESQVVAAEAAFDWTLFSNVQWSSTDEPRTASSIGNSPVGLTSDQRQIVQADAGVRKALTSGGQVTLQQTVTYTDVETPGLTEFPDPSGRLEVSATLDQPLLRNFGSDATLAQVRLGRNAERSAVADLQRQLLDVVTTTEQSYWNLLQAQADLVILERLLERGEEIERKVRSRVKIDATPAAVSDAAARVQARRANVMRAQRALRGASDQLKVLINDPELPVGSEVMLLAADRPIDAPITYSLLDSIITALENRPEIDQSILSIDDTTIRQQLAENQLLPQLDIRAQVAMSAIDGNTASTYEDVWDGTFVNYLVGLVFEQPIGNRAAEAQSRQRRLERSQAVISYRNTVQQLIAEIRSALDELTLNYRLIGQTRAARLAAAENLRALKAASDLTQGYSVERLDLELNRQEALAQAERDEIASLIDYNVAVANLHRAMGTALARNGIEFVVPDAQDALTPRGTRRPQLPTGSVSGPDLGGEVFEAEPIGTESDAVIAEPDRAGSSAASSGGVIVAEPE